MIVRIGYEGCRSNDYVAVVVITDHRLKNPAYIPGRLNILKMLGFDTGPGTTLASS